MSRGLRSDAGRPRVVILGGGFGGLYAARGLAGAPVDITLVDRRNHHVFQPLLYQVASAALSPSEVAQPIRSTLRRQRNARVLLDEARGVDVAHRTVDLACETCGYDYLVVATGAGHSYFGHEAWREFAPGLKSIEDALEIRRRVLLAYEIAERQPERAPEWLTFVVVGGGPTGVELAGSFMEISRHTLARDFRSIDPRQARVILLEGGSAVLAAFPPDLQAKARAELEHLRVEVRTDARVTHVDELGVQVGDERITARTVLWAAGVEPSPIGRTLGTPLDEAGRVRVEDDLTIPGHDEVFVIGDLAAATCDDRPLPGVAQAAIQGGRHAARCIRRRVKGDPNLPFHYRDRGSLATIGRAAAVADLGRLRFSGLPAWIAWLVVHIAFLIGFRNRLFVLMSWAWSYLTFRRGARLITGADHELRPLRHPDGESTCTPAVDRDLARPVADRH